MSLAQGLGAIDTPIARTRWRAASIWPVLAALLVLFVLLAHVLGAVRHGGVMLQDDGYYYTVIARHIARSGVSTFDGSSLTNGYHPLWMLVLVAQDLTVGPSALATVVLEALLTSAAAYLFLDRGAARRPLACAVFAYVYLQLVSGMVLSGMEVALFLFCTGLFVAVLDAARRTSSLTRAVLLGVTAALMVGSRIDAAFFVLPALIAAPVPRRDRLVALAVLAAAGAAYGAYNLATFGAALPISSAIKSLGGLQWNALVVRQMRLDWSTLHFRSILVCTLAALLLSPLLLIASRRDTLARCLSIAAVVGGAIYIVKILLLSSWRIWGWYGFAVIFPLLAALYMAAPAVEAWWGRSRPARRPGRWAGAVQAVAVSLVLALVGKQAIRLLHAPSLRKSTYSAINHLALVRYGPLLGGAPVAMGDRAGSFAAEYPGPVVQLEGLVNDVAYLRAVKAGDDVTGLLCRRGVKFLADYEVDLGRYDRHRIVLLRPALTQFHGPTATVERKDEVGEVSDIRLFDARDFTTMEADNTLYIWRLSCPASRLSTAARG